MNAAERIAQILEDLGDAPAEEKRKDFREKRADEIASLLLGREIHTNRHAIETVMRTVETGVPQEPMDTIPARNSLRSAAARADVPFTRPLARPRVPVIGFLTNCFRRLHRRLVGCMYRPIMEDYRKLHQDLISSIDLLSAATEGVIRNYIRFTENTDRAFAAVNENEEKLLQLIRDRLYSREDDTAEALKVLIDDVCGLSEELQSEKKQIGELNEERARLGDHFEEELNGLRKESEKVGELAVRLDDLSTRMNELISQRDELISQRDELISQKEALNSRMNDLVVRMETVELSDFRRRRHEGTAECRNAAAGTGKAETAEAAEEPAAEENAYQAVDYFEFENLLRGSQESVRNAQKQYLPLLRQDAPVFDLGCGRGELLSLLKENGIPADGAELYEEYAAFCRDKGLDVVCGDGIAVLKGKEDDSLGGVTAMQVIEHLTPGQISDLCSTAYRKLRKGGRLILETPNPLCLSIYTNAFYMDPSHTRPVHPKTMEYLLKKTGFSSVKVIFTENSKVGYRLPLLSVSDAGNLKEFNDGINLLSDLIFGSQDYAIIAEK